MAYTPEQRRAWEHRTWHGRRNAWFAGKVCVECGTAEDLELDHIDPSEKIAHNVWMWGAARREAELAKCQPMCHDCHVAKHSRLRRLGHGTRARYQRGCRCSPCHEAKAAEMAVYRQRHAAGLIKSRRRSPCGTRAAYGYGCRCAACRAANTVAFRAYRKRKGEAKA